MNINEDENRNEADNYEQLLSQYKTVCYENKRLKEEIEDLEKFQPNINRVHSRFKTSWFVLGTIACLIAYLIASCAPQGWQLGNAIMVADYFERFFLWLCIPMGMYTLCSFVFCLGDLLCNSWSKFLSLFLKKKNSKSWAKTILYILAAAALAFLK